MIKTRRELLRLAGLGLASAPVMNILGGRRSGSVDYAPATDEHFQGTDEQLLDEIQRTAFDFFWSESSARTGQTKDRALANGNDTRKMSSIAATGFGLTALCIGDRRGYRDAKEIRERVRTTLRFLANELQHEHGFFYHFIHIETGARWGNVELSSIDTSLLLCGVLTARQYFADAEITNLATKIYERVDWPWMLNGGKTFSMGWKPDSGFLQSRWEHFCELMMIYLLGMGSPTHSVPAETWDAWTRPIVKYQGLEFISGNDPIFTHQYSQAWFDFRGKRDKYANYFENSVTATKAHKLFCLSLRDRFPDYSEDLWGISASDYEKGYTAWGGPPAQGPIDGTIVPCATGGSLPFLFEDCVRVLRTLRGPYAKRVWTKYGLLDAFNPLTGWYDSDVLGIDQGITMVMAENHRTGFVWDVFMKDEDVKRGMQRAGFQPETTRIPAK
ncbi:MAG TPA: glucoamylase family protein [Candidatus Acidoferrum sp.]|nr:glucoamylase family protein [Candidatus Acidoferrum sp.]